MKQYLLILFTIFLKFNLYAESIEDNRLNKQIEILQSQQVDTILIHKYALFNGRFNISTDYKELNCEGRPYVYHFFWKKKGEIFCKRMDDCGEFTDVPIKMKDFDVLISSLSSTQIEFKRQSPHFTVVEITILLQDSKKQVRVSGTQMKNGKSEAIDKIELLNKKIKNLESEGHFKRI